VLHARLTEIQDTKICQNSPAAHHSTTLSGYIFVTKVCVDNRKNSNTSSTCPHNNGELWPTNGWDRLATLGHHSKFQHDGILPGAKHIHFPLKSCVLLYWQRYYTALESGRQPNFAAWHKEWNYGTFAPRLHHLYSAGRPSRWASAHFLVSACFHSFHIGER